MASSAAAAAGPSASAPVAQRPPVPAAALVPALESPPAEGEAEGEAAGGSSDEPPKVPCVLLGVCGHDAAGEQVPALVARLLEFAQVKVVCTPAVEGFAPSLLAQLERAHTGVETYVADDLRLLNRRNALSTTLRGWADVLLVAPLSLDTLAELANGLETNLLTIVARHWETEPAEGNASTQGTPDRPFIVVPAAAPRALRHPTTSRHWTQLRDLGVSFLAMDPSEEEPLPRGTRVLLGDLVARADLNGTYGEVQEWNQGSGWYTVRLDQSDKPASIKPANLQADPPLDAMTADVDTIVEHVKHVITEESNMHGFAQDDAAEGEQQPKRQRQRQQ